MKKILFLSAVLIIALQKCSSPTGPPPPVKPVKNPREYTWTIDTLFYPTGLQTSMYSIWGSSPDNMYTVGHSGDIRGQAWHYDGKQWKDFYLPFGVRYSFRNVYGFSANDIWVVGGYFGTRSTVDSTFIMHFDGGSWKRINASGGKIIETVWGSSPNDIWFGGINGTLFHWDGTSVKRDSLPIYIPKDADPFYNFNKIYGKPSGDTFFLTSAPSGKSYLFLRKQENWSVIDSSAWFRNRVWVSEKGDLYESGSGGFYKWTGYVWGNILGRFDGFTGGIGAASESNMFIVGSGSTPESGGKYTGLVYHYNGKDFYLYENLKLDGVIFTDAWTDGTEVFIVGVTGEFLQKTIILHGK